MLASKGHFACFFLLNSPFKPIHVLAEDDMFLWLEGKFMQVFHSQSGYGFILLSIDICWVM